MVATAGFRQYLIMLDYESLRVICWLILALLLAAAAMIDGIELGFGAIFPFIGRNEPDRQELLESVRPVGFGLRKHLPGSRWRGAWDGARCIGATAAALFSGVAFGNLFLGLPFHNEGLQKIVYTGGVFNLFTPFACLCGAVSLTMIVLHGACYAAMKARDPLAQRARHAGIGAAGLFVIAFIAAGIGVIFLLEGYRVLGHSNPLAASNPTLKWVTQSAPGAWLDNYIRWPLMWLAPLSALLGALFACWLLILRWARAAFVASCLVPLGAILTAGFALFPFLLPSSENPNHSFTVWDASNSAATLCTLGLGILLILPILLSYAARVSDVLRARSALQALHDQT